MSNIPDQANTFFQGRAKLNEPLAPYTTFKIGGPADLFYEAATADEVKEAVTVARSLDLPVFVLGGGSNVLFADEGFRGVIVHWRSRACQVIDEHTARAEGGVPLVKLAKLTVQQGLTGVEFGIGIPGSVGGGIFMNAHWHGYFLGDSLKQVTLLTTDNEVVQVPASYMKFTYDYSYIQETGEIVLLADFAVERDETGECARKLKAYNLERKEKQPLEEPSAGCAFRNVPEALVRHLGDKSATSSGWLIDRSGMKGRQIGGAQVSPKHANFIINTGAATAHDVLQIMDEVRNTVQSRFAVSLESEIVCVGPTGRMPF